MRMRAEPGNQESQEDETGRPAGIDGRAMMIRAMMIRAMMIRAMMIRAGPPSVPASAEASIVGVSDPTVRVTISSNG